jgi:hypothetical protein
MLRRLLLRLILPAIFGSLLGFLALAFAVQDEPTLPTPLLSIFSPGLKLAEMVTPAKHESLGSTFGGFLRVAIGVNAVLYFSIFALAGYLIDRRLSRQPNFALYSIARAYSIRGVWSRMHRGNSRDPTNPGRNEWSAEESF